MGPQPRGLDGEDTISGKKGNDKLYGGDADDSLYGGPGKDKLRGDAGSDNIDGGTGNDKLTGGADGDRFIFKTRYDKDTILDFEIGDGIVYDVLDLSGLKSVKDFADLAENHIRQAGKNVVIDGGHGDVVVLKNIDLGDLTTDHFSF